MPVALVTDSTASLPVEVAESRGIRVVPLQVVIGAASYDEGADHVRADKVAAALREWEPVSTSRPTPESILRVYRDLAEEGATEIVSAHLSGSMSGTFESVRVAAEQSPVPVHAVDTRQVGLGTGFAVLAAADARDAGGDGEVVAKAARAQADATTSLFYVDTLEYLRRGGRIGAAGALLGSALAVKPILKIVEGRVGPYEKVRTAARALARLEELAVTAAGEAGSLRVAVAHLANSDRADALAARLTTRLGDRLRDPVYVGEVGAVLGAHVGPGMVAVNVAASVD